LLIMRGEFRAGSDLLRTTFDIYERIGRAVWYPEFLGVLAERLAGLGRLTEALATVDQALARADRGGERYYVAELLRIKGEVLLQLAGDQSIPAAQGCFHEALEIAQERGALFWELRAALRLARLRMRQDRRTDGRQILAPVCDRFTEGFETTDLKQAKTLLEQLA
jgi:predicted ATPase